MARTNSFLPDSAPYGERPSEGIQENSPLPLSDAQLGIWFAQSIDPSSPDQNIAEYLEIGGAIDVAQFEAALRQVVDEAECLCVRFISAADGPRQILGVAPNFAVAIVDVSALADPQAAAEAWMKADLAKPFDLTGETLFSYALFKVRSDCFYWYSKYHHIVMDGFGLALMAQRVAKCVHRAIERCERRSCCALARLRH